MAAIHLSPRAVILVHGYIRECSKALLKDKNVPDDVLNMCWKFFFIAFNSSIITTDNALNDFFELISEKISIKRMENAKLLYQGTVDKDDEDKFPYDQLRHKGPYLFIIESTDGHIFGGYCFRNIKEKDENYCSLSGKFLRDEMAFVWVLKGVDVQKPAIYSIKAGGRDAVYYDAFRYWWIFGTSPFDHDICLYRGLASDHYCCVNNARGSLLKYNIPKGKTLLGGNSRHVFQMSEIEIFSVPN